MQFIQRGIPSVLLVSEQFAKLGRLVLRSHDMSEAVAVIIPGNPAYADAKTLERLASDALAECVSKIASTAGESGR